MSIFKRILYPTDFSESSLTALDQAIALARAYDAEIAALHVSEPGRSGGRSREDLTNDLRALLTPAGHRGIKTEVRLREGKPAEEIVNHLQETPADVVVMGTHGRKGFDRFFIGSVTEEVLRTAPCPVMTVSHRTSRLAPPDVPPFRTILCAVDFSESSKKARDLAFAVAKQSEARVLQLNVVEILPEWESRELAHFNVPEFARYLEQDAIAAMRDAVPEDAKRWSKPEELVSRGKAWMEILRIAGKHRADLIVMGMQGRGRLDQLLFGSTTLHIVRGAHCPVLTTR